MPISLHGLVQHFSHPPSSSLSHSTGLAFSKTNAAPPTTWNPSTCSTSISYSKARCNTMRLHLKCTRQTSESSERQRRPLHILFTYTAVAVAVIATTTIWEARLLNVWTCRAFSVKLPLEIIWVKNATTGKRTKPWAVHCCFHTIVLTATRRLLHQVGWSFPLFVLRRGTKPIMVLHTHFWYVLKRNTFYGDYANLQAAWLIAIYNFLPPRGLQCVFTRIYGSNLVSWGFLSSRLEWYSMSVFLLL